MLHRFLGIVCLGAAIVAGTQAQAQIIAGSPTVALKSGETIELGVVYLVTNCRSILTSTPEAEILAGPSQVTVSIKQEMVLPRAHQCASRVSGGKLMITAKEIEEPSYSNLTVRITYKTKDGERKYSQIYNLHLLP